MNKIEVIEILIFVFFLAIPFIVGYIIGKRAGLKASGKLEEKES